MKLFSAPRPRALFFFSALFVITVDVILSGSAFRIDDSLFLWTAERILNAPFDPFSFDVNWYGFYQKMAEVLQNPPFVSYYQALIALVFGFSETSLHIGFIVPALICMYAVYRLSWRLGGDGGVSVLLLASSPVYLLCSTVVMSDMWMTCFWCLAASFWVKGVQEEKPCDLAFGAFFSGMAALSKYYGLACPLLLAVYALCQKRRKPSHILYGAIPALMISSWGYYSKELYGISHITQAVSYGANEFIVEALAGKILVTLSFVGGCTLFPLLILFWESKKKGGMALWGCVSLIFLAAGIWAVEFHVFHKKISWVQISQFVLFGTIGAAILWKTICLFMEEKSPENLFILFWMFGTVIFVGFLNWTVAGRNILPLAPACTILMSKIFKKRLGQEELPFYKEVRTSFVIAVSLVAATLFTWADSSRANSIRQSAKEIYDLSGKQAGNVWFQGHWGFQYYMENLGAVPLDYTKKGQHRGEILVIPVQNTNIIIPDKNDPAAKLIQIFKHSNGTDISTFGFYSSLYSPIPFSLSGAANHIYLIYQVR